ncbi:succinate dehydrogenase cytochrome b subunit [Actinomycetaceae bacterium WB03_NA08]|uniref:Succinate dehydrogenase cytochrome b subunit n=1 Tax=Scrofimicrobium canadense TaxID=2652290 RepID=A0A6N7W399_9ACTO|nr:succinate dehydrogenase cytochrome b subunit [Scrofimicrobium canadense]MSS83765.1 succinate dehydrogenase cytochrome b subunit [Scrofimicrobium canadense]
MATNTVATKKRRAWTTGVFVKQLMAISGLVFVLFLLFHSYGNLKMFLGPDAYNHYAEWLKTDMLYPILPKGGFIWLFRTVLLLLILIHIIAAFIVWFHAKKARRNGYVVKKSAVDAYAARTMRLSGVALIFLIFFHILHFTTKTVKTGFTAEATPYQMMVDSFQNPWVFILYLVFVALVTSHVGHGFWSAFQTMGWVRANTRTFMVWLSGLIATIIFVMFMITPLAITVGWIQ